MRRPIPTRSRSALLRSWRRDFRPLVELLEDRLAPNDLVGAAMLAAPPASAAESSTQPAAPAAEAAPEILQIDSGSWLLDVAATPPAVEMPPPAAPAPKVEYVEPGDEAESDLLVDPLAAAPPIDQELGEEPAWEVLPVMPTEEAAGPVAVESALPAEALAASSTEEAVGGGGNVSSPSPSAFTPPAFSEGVASLLAAVANSWSRFRGQAESQPPADAYAPRQNELLAAGFQRTVWQGQSIFARPGEWIVSIGGLTGTAAAQIDQLNIALRGSKLPISVAQHLGKDGLFLLDVSPQLSQQIVMKALYVLPGFRHAEPNGAIWSDAAPNDPLYQPYQYGLHNYGQKIPQPNGPSGTADADIDAPEAWNLTTGSRSVVVGVIDTGVDFNHPDLLANIWVNPGEIPGDGIDNDGNGYVDDIRGWNWVSNTNNVMDDNGHGTHVAGTIAAVGNNGVGVTGVAWQTQIMALKFLDKNGSGTTAAAISAVNYATKMRRDHGVNVVLTNNSWGGGGYSQALYNAILESQNAGLLFVAAAGNDGRNNDITPSYPASYNLASIIRVAATNNRDVLASFSNYGAVSVDLAAPGVDIASTYPGNQYVYMSGTSMATPMVSGVAALAFAYKPAATWQEVKSAILGGVDAKSNLAGKVATGGRLNAYNTLQLLNVAPDSPPVISSVSAAPSPVSGVSTTLSAAASDPDGDPLIYSWSQVAGPASASFGSSGSASTTVAFTQAGTYQFRATVTANGLSDSRIVEVIVQQTLASITVAPHSVSVQAGGTQQFAAAARDQFGAVMAAAVTWSAEGGTIDGNGLFTAGSTGGDFTITASSGAASGSATVTVTLPNAAPTIDGITANHAVGGAATTLMVSASDAEGDALNYSWTQVAGPAGVVFGAAAAAATSVAFSQAGVYVFQATVTAAGQSTTAQVAVTVNQTLTSISVAPGSASVVAGGTQQFTAAARDQFGAGMSAAVAWSVSGGGSISATGLFTAGVAAGGPFTVTASSDGISGTAAVSVTPAYIPGLKAEFFDYTTSLSALPNLTGRTPNVTRTDARINYASTSNAWSGLGTKFRDTFAARWTGKVYIAAGGSYTFYLNSDDGSKLWIDGVLVVINDGAHSMRERSGTITLTPGYHDIRVEYFENTGSAGMIMSWAGPGIAKQIVPANVLFQSV